MVWGIIILRYYPSWRKPASEPTPLITKDKIAAALEVPLHSNQFPEQLEVAVDAKPQKLTPHYTIDFDAQETVEKLYRSYRPDYAAFVALEADTGRILALTSFTRKPVELGNLALKASFPAASLFKIVTAAAALDQGKAQPDTVITFSGANHTLYRRNVNQTQTNRWSRHMTLREAFAKSVNTVFAKLGLFLLEPLHLKTYAHRFQFNQFIATDVPVEPGRFVLPENNAWAVAEAASGFNRLATISPLQASLMASAVANDGVLMEPYVVESLFTEHNLPLYEATPKTVTVTMTPETAESLRVLMRETVSRGTSRASFRTLLRKKRFSDIDMGGKTGSLHSQYPKGKVDWFVGYAIGEGQRIAVAALTVNEDFWRVKSSFIARSFLEHYFTSLPQEQ